jgi:hypothetical protein
MWGSAHIDDSVRLGTPVRMSSILLRMVLDSYAKVEFIDAEGESAQITMDSQTPRHGSQVKYA